MDKHSWLSLSRGDARPFYVQVIQQIKQRVAVGDLRAGTELPSIRQLAADLRVSVITIKRAYMELERDGIIETRQGKGSIVALRPGLQASVQRAELEDHLQQAVRLGRLLGLSKSEMECQIRQAYEQTEEP